MPQPLNLRFAALAAVLATLTNGTLSAQASGAAAGPARPVSIWLGVSASTPVSDFKELAKSGFAGQGAVQYRPAGSVFGVRGELQYHKMDMTAESLAEAGASAGITGTWSVLYGGVAAVMESMPARAGLGWYVLAGGGSYRVEPSISDGGISASISKTKLGFNGGAGIRVRLGAVAAFVEGRYHTVTIEDSKVTLLPVSLGLVF